MIAVATVDKWKCYFPINTFYFHCFLFQILIDSKSKEYKNNRQLLKQFVDISTAFCFKHSLPVSSLFRV